MWTTHINLPFASSIEFIVILILYKVPLLIKITLSYILVHLIALHALRAKDGVAHITPSSNSSGFQMVFQIRNFICSC